MTEQEFIDKIKTNVAVQRNRSKSDDESFVSLTISYFQEYMRNYYASDPDDGRMYTEYNSVKATEWCTRCLTQGVDFRVLAIIINELE